MERYIGLDAHASSCTPILPPRAAVGAADGLSFIPGNQRCCDRSYREAVDDHGQPGGRGRREQYRCPQCGSFGPKVSDH